VVGSVFKDLHNRSTNTCPTPLPRPSMLTDTPTDSSRPVNDLAVYCTP